METSRSSHERASSEIDAIIGGSEDWRGETLAALRAVVRSASPEIVEEVKWKKPSRPEGVAVWSCHGNVCIGEMLKNVVRLTFPKGAQLSDPSGLFNARMDSASVRAIDVARGAKVPTAPLRRLVVEGVKVNTRARP